MIKKFKQFENFLRELRGNQLAIRNGQQQLWASQKLQTLFGVETFIPQTSWAIQPEALLHILNIISINKPKAIIEFGGGITTLYIAKLLQIENSNATFISVESDEQWLSTLKSKLAENKLEKKVTQVYAPIQQIDAKLAFKEQKLWYSKTAVDDAIMNVSNFDLVIVDGPFGGSTPYARYSAMPVLKKRTNDKTVWLLDDTGRIHENEIISEWRKLSGLHVRSFSRYTLLSQKSDFDNSSFRI